MHWLPLRCAACQSISIANRLLVQLVTGTHTVYCAGGGDASRDDEYVMDALAALRAEFAKLVPVVCAQVSENSMTGLRTISEMGEIN
jgi:hypothetical protein